MLCRSPTITCSQQSELEATCSTDGISGGKCPSEGELLSQEMRNSRIDGPSMDQRPVKVAGDFEDDVGLASQGRNLG